MAVVTRHDSKFAGSNVPKKINECHPGKPWNLAARLAPGSSLPGTSESGAA